MKQKIALLSLPILAVVCELLPYGAVLHFASPEEESVRQTYSYFDLVPFGYANFAPLITAVLTCLLLVFSIVYFIKGGSGIKKTITVLSLIAALISLAPLLYGLRFWSVIGAVITALLFADFGISLIK